MTFLRETYYARPPLTLLVKLRPLEKTFTPLPYALATSLLPAIAQPSADTRQAHRTERHMLSPKILY